MTSRGYDYTITYPWTILYSTIYCKMFSYLKISFIILTFNCNQKKAIKSSWSSLDYVFRHLLGRSIFPKKIIIIIIRAAFFIFWNSRSFFLWMRKSWATNLNYLNIYYNLKSLVKIGQKKISVCKILAGPLLKLCWL